MTWEDDMVCRCGHSIDVHMSSCLVPDCECKRSMERIYDTEIARSIMGDR